MLKRAVIKKSTSEQSFVGRGFCRLARVCADFTVMRLLGKNDLDKTLVNWINFCNKYCKKQEFCNHGRFPSQLVSILATLFTACRHTRLPHTVTGIIFYSNSMLNLLQILSQMPSTPSSYLHIPEMRNVYVPPSFTDSALKLRSYYKWNAISGLFLS